MELYCGGNQIEGVREVGHLRGLPKLIILDLTGNPMAAHEDYRLYTIYHLRKLKVHSFTYAGPGLLLGTEAPAMMPSSVYVFSLFFFLFLLSHRSQLQNPHLSAYVHIPPHTPPPPLSSPSCLATNQLQSCAPLRFHS